MYVSVWRPRMLSNPHPQWTEDNEKETLAWTPGLKQWPTTQAAASVLVDFFHCSFIWKNKWTPLNSKHKHPRFQTISIIHITRDKAFNSYSTCSNIGCPDWPQFNKKFTFTIFIVEEGDWQIFEYYISITWWYSVYLVLHSSWMTIRAVGIRHWRIRRGRAFFVT